MLRRALKRTARRASRVIIRAPCTGTLEGETGCTTPQSKEYRRRPTMAIASPGAVAREAIQRNGWERWHDWNAVVFASMTQWFCEACGAAPGQVILDAACGTGLPSLALAECVRPNGKVVAIDTSTSMIAAAMRIARSAGVGNIEHRPMDVAALEFDDASFDAVTCKEGLMFCADPVKAASELRRVLKPGGRFAV